MVDVYAVSPSFIFCQRQGITSDIFAPFTVYCWIELSLHENRKNGFTFPTPDL